MIALFKCSIMTVYHQISFFLSDQIQRNIERNSLLIIHGMDIGIKHRNN